MATAPWGVFVDVGPNKDVHVAPATEDGRVDRDHVLSSDCWCRPTAKRPRGPLDDPFFDHHDSAVAGSTDRPS